MTHPCETHLFYCGYVDPDFDGAFKQLVEHRDGEQKDYSEFFGHRQTGWHLPNGLNQGMLAMMAISGFKWACALKTTSQGDTLWEWTMKQKNNTLAQTQTPLNMFDPRPKNARFSDVLQGQTGVLYSYHETLCKHKQGCPIYHQNLPDL